MSYILRPQDCQVGPTPNNVYDNISPLLLFKRYRGSRDISVLSADQTMPKLGRTLFRCSNQFMGVTSCSRTRHLLIFVRQSAPSTRSSLSIRLLQTATCPGRDTGKAHTMSYKESTNDKAPWFSGRVAFHFLLHECTMISGSRQLLPSSIRPT